MNTNIGSSTILRNRRYTPLQLDTKSDSYFRMTRAGFSFEVGDLSYYFNGFMTCVCGRKQYFSFPKNMAKNGKIDVAGFAELNGFVSHRHLKDDGYSMKEIKSIRTAFI